MKKSFSNLILISGILLLAACSSNQVPNQKLASKVDIDKFMGTWYVHGYTPTAIDKGAWNGTETYERLPNGKIQTTYEFRKGSPDGKIKAYHPVGTIKDTVTNAEWRMRFFGVINAAYYILYVDAEHTFTVIGHPNKKYAWIMSRESKIPDESYSELRSELVEREYDLSKFVRMQHEWR